LPITLFPLDVTHEVRLLREDVAGYARDGCRLAGLILEIAPTYFEFHQRESGFPGTYIHDALPVAALLQPDLFAYELMRVSVGEDGMSVGAGVPRDQTIRVATTVRSNALFQKFWEVLTRTP
jgi:inosine-uridine nucleoside N-ribohydrolase